MRGTAQLKIYLFLLSVAVLVSPLACKRGHSQVAAASITPTPETKPAPPTPLAVKKAELGDDTTWNPEWDNVVETAIPPELLSSRVPRDVRRFCPRFYQMEEIDKRAFWAYFFQALAGAEAGLNPRTNVRHTEPEVAVVDAVTHQLVHSEGLLQLTYEDQQRYGCDFNWEVDRHLPPHDPQRTILNPENNLKCGINILSNQIIDQHKSLFAHTSYWSTLQPGTVSFRVFVKQMTNPPESCGLHKAAVKHRSVDKGTAEVASSLR
ncbi:hypothetical protein H7849_20120 [Alloacidobacterium dinghuense]|uniref:Uncharacterized protein n=1 Tax=Alloacidobacterium dinghuense TaxID=2763107 RepID=A0A7G8BFP4_9BACT|nr:hypothetical protein [Alloacidobacterium dinghuense]QNI31364.1 hypothetical protein H7849_20120 [Alloacidobacterium dinghuense]